MNKPELSGAYKPMHTWYLMALLAFILLFHLSATPIYILDEAKNAQCAREMLQRNDWVVPTFNGELRTDKPVLHYYFMMAAYKVFGVNEFAARFFSALLGWLTVLFTFLFTRRFTNSVTAFCAAIVLAASTHFLFEFRLAVPDPYLIFFITAGLFTAFIYLQQGRLNYLIIAAVSFALATLAKGPVALALPGLCLLTWVIIKKKWRFVFTWKMIAVIALIAFITLPWYIAVHNATNGAWTRGFFIDHNINRFSDPQEGHGGLFILTLIFVIVGLLPFTSFTGEVVKRRSVVFSDDLVKFSGIVVLIFTVFFSVASTKLPNYPMPCYPFGAIIIGNYLSKLVNDEAQFKKYPLYILIGFTLLLPFAGYFALGAEQEAAHIKSVAFILILAPVSLLVVSFIWKKITGYVKIIGIVIAYGIFNMIALYIIYPVIYAQNPVFKTITEVKKHSVIYSYGLYNPGYNFYINTNVQKFSNADTLRDALLKNPGAIVISRLDNSEDLRKLRLREVARHHDLFESPTTVLYVVENKP